MSGAALQNQPPRKQRILRVELNSNDRNFKTYPNPANFQWVSSYALKNITSICIVGGTVPIPLYTIDAPYNSFTFDTGSKKVTVTFPPGVYTNTTAASKLATLLTTADGSNIYTTAIDPITQLLTITSNGMNVFGFLFASGQFVNTMNSGLATVGNPAYLLGFTNADYYSVSLVLVSVNPMNVTSLKRVYLYLNYDGTSDLHSIEVGNGRKPPSAILYCADQDTLLSSTKSLNRDTYENMISPGNPLTRIRSFQITLQDEFGTVLNTNNRPVSILLEITVFE